MASTILSWVFGILFLVIGVVNLFWGNDPGFGVFVILLSSIYFPPANAVLKKRFGLSVPRLVKILLTIFLLWAALGVGELIEKIELMLRVQKQETDYSQAY